MKIRPAAEFHWRPLLTVACLLLGMAHAQSAPPIMALQGVVQWQTFPSQTLIVTVTTGPLSGSTITLGFDNASRITREGAPAAFLNVRVGDVVRCTISRALPDRYVVQELDAATVYGRRVFGGALQSVDRVSLGRQKLVVAVVVGSTIMNINAFFDDQTLFRKEGQPCGPGDLASASETTMNDVVSVVGVARSDGILATRVDAAIPAAYKPVALAGVVSKVQHGQLVVLVPNGAEVPVVVGSSTFVRKDQGGVDPSKLERVIKRGDQATCFGVPTADGVLSAVCVLVRSPDREAPAATVTQVDYANQSLVIFTGGQLITVLIPSSASVQINGQPASLMDVVTWATVSVRAVGLADGSWVATSLDVVQ